MKASDLVSTARKATAALSGAAAEAVAAGLLHGDAEKWTTGILAAVTTALVYLVPNTPPAAAQRDRRPGAPRDPSAYS